MNKKKLHIKVCGLTDRNNYKNICELNIEMVGFNFYPKSKRYVNENLYKQVENVKRVGVFVQASQDEVLKRKSLFHLDYAQLHGDESVEECRAIQGLIPILKVFRVDESFDMKSTKDFDFCDFFLFDTKVDSYGGSGQKFQWKKLNEYKGKVPFMLSGGIGPEDVEAIKKINHSALMGLDLNSGFEIQAGIKDASLLREFVYKLSK